MMQKMFLKSIKFFFYKLKISYQKKLSAHVMVLREELIVIVLFNTFSAVMWSVAAFISSTWFFMVERSFSALHRLIRL